MENHNITGNADAIKGRIGVAMDGLLTTLFPGRFHELPWLHPLTGFGRPVPAGQTAAQTKQRTPPWYNLREGKNGASSLVDLFRFFKPREPVEPLPPPKPPRLKKNGQPYAVRVKKPKPPPR